MFANLIMALEHNFYFKKDAIIKRIIRFLANDDVF